MSDIIEYQGDQLPAVDSSITLPAINPREIANRREAVKTIMRSQMQYGVHYGHIPGMARDGLPMLRKEGIEMLANTFMLGCNPLVENLEPAGPEVRYRVITELIHLPTNKVAGRGVGECSSLEEKYAWRAAVCPEEYHDYPTDRRRLKWKQSWEQGRMVRNTGYKVLQVRVEPQDKANTILKMAKIRSFRDAIQTALGVTDMFAAEPGDDDAPPEPQKGRFQRRNAPPSQSPRQESHQGAPTGKLSEGMLNTINRALQRVGVEIVPDLLAEFAVNTLNEIPASKINDVLDWLKEQGGNDG